MWLTVLKRFRLFFEGEPVFFWVLVLLSDYSCFLVKLACMGISSCGLDMFEGVVWPVEALVNLLRRI